MNDFINIFKEASKEKLSMLDKQLKMAEDMGLETDLVKEMQKRLKQQKKDIEKEFGK